MSKDTDDMEKQNGVERRINMAVTLERIDGRLANIEKKQIRCTDDRDALFKRIRQVDRHQIAIETKQKGIIAIGSMVGLATVGIVIRAAYTIFSKNPPPPHLPH